MGGGQVAGGGGRGGGVGHCNLSSRNFGVYSTVRHTFYFDLFDSHLGGIVNGKETKFQV